jgi:hypothetical protein
VIYYHEINVIFFVIYYILVLYILKSCFRVLQRSAIAGNFVMSFTFCPCWLVTRVEQISEIFYKRKK